MYTNVLIPTDGSEVARKAVRHGIALAQRIGAMKLRLRKLADLVSAVIDRSILLQDAEFHAPGRELALFSDVKRRFPTREKVVALVSDKDAAR